MKNSLGPSPVPISFAFRVCFFPSSFDNSKTDDNPNAGFNHQTGIFKAPMDGLYLATCNMRM